MFNPVVMDRSVAYVDRNMAGMTYKKNWLLSRINRYVEAANWKALNLFLSQEIGQLTADEMLACLRATFAVRRDLPVWIHLWDRFRDECRCVDDAALLRMWEDT